MQVTGKYLEARRQIRPKFGCAVCFVSALFEVVQFEGVCGRFGRIGVKTNTYRALRGLAARLAPEDRVESFTVCGFWLFRQLEHMNC